MGPEGWGHERLKASRRLPMLGALCLYAQFTRPAAAGPAQKHQLSQLTSPPPPSLQTGATTAAEGLSCPAGWFIDGGPLPPPPATSRRSLQLGGAPPPPPVQFVAAPPSDTSSS